MVDGICLSCRVFLCCLILKLGSIIAQNIFWGIDRMFKENIEELRGEDSIGTCRETRVRIFSVVIFV
jgi:hypothetical protein